MILLNRKWANVFNKSVPWVAQEGMTKGKLVLEIFKESFRFNKKSHQRSF